MRASQPALITLGGVFLGYLLIAPASSLAQKRGDTSVGSGASTRRDAILSREADLQNRELRLRLLNEPEKARTVTAADRKVIVTQIFEDFERVQVVNREMMQASSNPDNNAYKRISSLADEMNKRAKRLKTNLNIPDLEGDKKESEPSAEINAAQLKACVQTLNGSLKKFVSSPVFLNPKVTQVRHLLDLKQDISDVIELSRTVKKAAAKLHN